MEKFEFVVIHGSHKDTDGVHGIGDKVQLTAEEKEALDPNDERFVTPEVAAEMDQIAEAQERKEAAKKAAADRMAALKEKQVSKRANGKKKKSEG